MLRQNVNEIGIPISATLVGGKDIYTTQACGLENDTSPDFSELARDLRATNDVSV